MIKALLFDVDGVITEKFTQKTAAAFCDHYAVTADAFAEACRLASPGLDEGTITEHQFLEQVISQLQLTVPIDEVQTFFEQEDAKHLQLRQDIINFIQTHKTAYTIALVSNVSDGLHARLERLGVYDCVAPDNRFFSFQLHLVKPQKELFEHVLHTLDIQPNEAVFIDDSEANIAGAEACGIKSILFTSTAEVLSELKHLMTI